jgi:catechol 2,3-dioxygenase-like lactoylglutathione lyase family enzyme
MSATPNYTAKLLSPILPVADMATTIRFYIEILGFDVVMESESYSILRRASVSLHLTKAHEGVLDAARGHVSIYLEVDDIEALWSHVSQFKARYKTRDLFDRAYGMREFHIADPDDCLIFVGQQIKSV